jgi:hypothetical protein
LCGNVGKAIASHEASRFSRVQPALPQCIEASRGLRWGPVAARDQRLRGDDHAARDLVAYGVGAHTDDEAAPDLKDGPTKLVRLGGDLFIVLQPVDLDSHEVVTEVVVEVPGAVGTLQRPLAPRLRETCAAYSAEELQLGERVRAALGVTDGLQEEPPAWQSPPSNGISAHGLRSDEPLLDSRRDDRAGAIRLPDGGVGGALNNAARQTQPRRLSGRVHLRGLEESRLVHPHC